MAKTEKEAKSAKNHFWKDFKAELKKVIWPTPKQIINNTTTVIGIVLITVAIVFVLDLAFDALNTYGINKLKTVVDNTTSTESAEGSVDANTLEENSNESTENVDTEDANVATSAE